MFVSRNITLIRHFILRYILILVFVNEEGNLVAEKAIEVAVNYIKKNNKLGVNTDPVRVVGNRSDASGLLDSRSYFYLI